MIRKELTANKGLVRVVFELPSSLRAERINLVGEFSNWDTTALLMNRNRPGGSWKIAVELEAGRRYRFRYLIDGQEWLNDWYADDYAENPYGSYDSVVDLTWLR